MSPIDDSLILTEDELDMEIRHFTDRLDIYPRSERRDILKALHWSRKLHEGQKRASGEPYIIHPIRTAEILIELQLDPSAIKGALLHDVLEDTQVGREDLIERFGPEVCATCGWCNQDRRYQYRREEHSQSRVPAQDGMGHG